MTGSYAGIYWLLIGSFLSWLCGAISVSHSGFRLTKLDQIDYLGIVSNLLVHNRTGAEVLLIEPTRNDTKEKLLLSSFRTPPTDNSGVAHIMEHSLLSGSTKYPLKNPFFNMAETSVATFLNAMTDADLTEYPFVTIDGQDLLNVASVYLDGIFDPICIHNRSIFEKEGWHFEYEEETDSLRYSGIVYNEMKGYYSKAALIGYGRVAKELFQGTPYEFSSGGVPEEIVQLDYDKFVQFYYQHYHPSNVKVIYYGSMDLAGSILDTLDHYFILADERYIKRFGSTVNAASMTKIPTIKFSPLDAEVKFVTQKVPATDDHEPRNSVWVNVVLADDKWSLCDRMSFRFLASMLMGSRESPLFKKLLDAGFSDHVTPGEIFQWGRVSLFLLQVKGIPKNWKCQNDNCAKVQNGETIGHAEFLNSFLDHSLREILDDGFDQTDIDGKLNRFEFLLKETVVNQDSMALQLSDNILERWNYDQDPLSYTKINEGLGCVRSRINEDPKFLSTLMKRYLLENRQRLVMLLEEDVDFLKKQEDAERGRLAAIRQKLSRDEIEQIVSRANSLREAQRKPDPPELLALLPRLQRSSLPRQAQRLDYNVTTIDRVPVVSLISATAEIAYCSMTLDMPWVEETDLLYLDLLIHLLLNGDSRNHVARELNQMKDNHMGRFSMAWKVLSPHEPMMVRDPERASLWLTISFACLRSQVAECVSIVREVLFSSQLERNKRKATIFVREELIQLELTLASQPNLFVVSEMKKLQSYAGALNDYMSGLPAVENMRELLKEIDEDWDLVAARLTGIWMKVLDRKRLAIRMTSDEATLDAAMKEIGGLVGLFNESSVVQPSFDLEKGFVYRAGEWMKGKRISYAPVKADVFRVYNTSSLVSFNYMAGVLYKPGSAKAYKHKIPARILSATYILPHIRFEGGAYGASFSVDEESGMYMFSTYRDPHVFRSFDVMLRTADEMFALAKSVEDRRIEEQIIRAISSMDRPVSRVDLCAAAFYRWATGWNETHEQKKRDELFSTNREDFESFAELFNASLSGGPLMAFSAANPSSLTLWKPPKRMEGTTIVSLRVPPPAPTPLGAGWRARSVRKES